MRHWKLASFLALLGLLLGGSITYTHDAYIYELTPQIYRWFEEIDTPKLDMLTLIEPYQISPPSAVSPRIPIPATELLVPQGIRLMVFAPHPDDETLAAGGLIQRVIANEGKVCVVFMTNGDGFMEGVRRAIRRNQTSAGDFIEYGNQRHSEALKALRELGLDSEDGVFLGFPDDGIDDLWSSYWSARKSYTSPYTRFDHPHYAESYNRWAKYSGIDLKDEIIRVMNDFTPDWIVVPDPRDVHPDHCTTAVFVLNALSRLREDEQENFVRTQIFSYLIHYMDFPASTAWAKEVKKVGIGGSSTAGGILSSTQWFSLTLSQDELLGKQHALSAHQSQLIALGYFLRQFLRPCEVFSRLNPAQVAAVPNEWAARFNRSNN